jgi:hypothetical protein
MSKVKKKPKSKGGRRCGRSRSPKQICSYIVASGYDYAAA